VKRFCIAFLLTVAGQSALGAYLFLQGLDGDSTNAAHKGWIDANDFAIAVRNVGGTRSQLAALSVDKPVDSSSPRLSLHAASGTQIPSAKLELLRFIENRHVRYYTLTFSNLIVTAVSQSGDGAAATERVEFDYTWLSWSYVEFDAGAGPAGSPITYWWDAARSVGGYSGAFRVSAMRSGANVVVSWPGESGKRYDILSSAQVIGPYTFARSVTNSYIGTHTTSFPLGPGALFFSVERR